MRKRDKCTGRFITTHGLSQSRANKSWQHMIQRCHNPNDKAYEDYGLEGITVCSRWKSFLNFYEDMGERPKNYSLDRIDYDSGYAPWNCRWTDARTQALNRCSTIFITYMAKTLCIKDWAKELNIKYLTLYMRLRRGWSVEEAFTKEVK